MGSLLQSMGVADLIAAEMKSASRQVHIGNQRQKDIKKIYISKATDLAPYARNPLEPLCWMKSVFYK